MSTGIAYTDSFLEHETGAGHPECKERLISIISHLKSKSYFSELVSIPILKSPEDPILKLHTEEYVERIKQIQGKNGYLDGDTPYSPGTSESAFLAVGAGIGLVDKVLDGEIQNGLALVRPPGHHAEEDHAMGFCLFNNIAIAARHIQSRGKQKIFILDWDVHHGNGTQNSFYEDDSVFFCSLHQFPFYPGTGRSSEIGEGKGKGCTLNIPLARGSGIFEYRSAFLNQVIPALEKFVPDFILISSGFDAHKMDPLAGMELPTKAFEEFTHLIKEKAKEFCKGNLVSFLEGGYNVEALAESVEVHLSVLRD